MTFDLIPKKPKPKKGTVGLVSCSSAKLPVPAPAEWLYSASSLFTTQYSHAVLHCEKVFILSALHGLISPQQWVKPYDCFLGGFTDKKKKAWQKKVIAKIPEATDLVVYAGSDYWDLLREVPNVRCASLEEDGLIHRIDKLIQEVGPTYRRPLGVKPARPVLGHVYSFGRKGAHLGVLKRWLLFNHWDPKNQLAYCLVTPLHVVTDGRVISKAYFMDPKSFL